MTYKVTLQIFEGPLDLLLYLVKQSHLEISTIPIASITDQYLKYLELMQALDLEIAGDFLVMAATLMQIKSRMLLPPEALPPEEREEPDPTQELIQRLLEYQRFKQAAEVLSTMEKTRLVQFSRSTSSEGPPSETEEELAEASLFDLLTAFSQFMAGDVSRELVHEIIRDEFTVEGKIHHLRRLLEEQVRVSFTELFSKAKNKLEVVATFLALLELIRLREIVVRQTQLFGEIVILRTTGRVEVAP
jgi:segregation and condensation protein A